MMETAHFFELLKAGLWDRPAKTSMFADTSINWPGIYDIARKQAVLGVVFDGMNTLPEELRPPRALYLQWCGMVAKIEETNQHINEVAHELSIFFRDKDVKVRMLKGQSVAACYPQRLHRQPGDIDFLCQKNKYKLTNRIFEQTQAVRHPGGTYKHTSYTYRGVEIELHRIAAMLRNPISDYRFQRYIMVEYDISLAHTISEDYRVYVPHHSIYTIYLLIHLMTHFIGGGVGLRQLCDWTLHAYYHWDDIDRDEVDYMVRKCGYLRPMRVFASIAVDYLGLPAQYSPVSIKNVDRRLAKAILDDILQTGNFGQHDDRVNRKLKGYWRIRFRNYTQSVRRGWRFFRLSPSEILWYPFTTFLIWVGVQFKNLKDKLIK